MKTSKQQFMEMRIIDDMRAELDYQLMLRRLEAEEMEYNEYTKQYETKTKNTTDKRDCDGN